MIGVDRMLGCSKAALIACCLLFLSSCGDKSPHQLPGRSLRSLTRMRRQKLRSGIRIVPYLSWLLPIRMAKIWGALCQTTKLYAEN